MLGKIFKEAREATGATQSEAAAATRLKMQHIEALEKEDFSIIAASAYAKGFIKLYAEYLQLDPAPLLADYQENFMPKSRQPLMGDDNSKPQHHHSVNEPSDQQGLGWSVPAIPSLRNIEWPFTFSKKIAGITVGAVLGLVFIVWLLSGITRRDQEEPNQVAGIQVHDKAPVDVTFFRTHVLIRNPPQPFIDQYIDP